MRRTASIDRLRVHVALYAIAEGVWPAHADYRRLRRYNGVLCQCGLTESFSEIADMTKDVSCACRQLWRRYRQAEPYCFRDCSVLRLSRDALSVSCVSEPL